VIPTAVGERGAKRKGGRDHLVVDLVGSFFPLKVT